MEPIIGSVLGTVGEHVDCHRNFQNDVNDLRKRVADLKRKRDDKVAELQIVDESEKQVKEEVRGWLEDVRRIIEIEMPDIEEKVQNISCLSRGSLGRRVRQKIQAVREIYDRGSFLEGLVIKRPPLVGTSLLVENLVGEVDVKEKIWEYLRGHEVGMIGVCGIGGVGKTTVMKHIHNELLKESIGFTKIIWVTVSQSLSVVKLQGDIAGEMNKSLPKGRDELKRASRLQDIMKTVKYALILDDVWDKFTLQRVGIPEPTIENGCKIVITSRSVDVCNYLRCQIVKVPPLPPQESLNLFLYTVGQDILHIPNLEKILKDMVAECAGLPLAIVVIAGSMRGVRDIRKWRSALRQLCDCVVGTKKDSEDEIFKRSKFEVFFTVDTMACSHQKSAVSPSIRPVATSDSSAGNISYGSSLQSVAILSKKLHDEIKMITGAVQIAGPRPSISPVSLLQALPALPIMDSTSSPTPVNPPAKPTWADVVDSRKGTLSFLPPEFRNGRLVVPDDVHVVGLESWNNCLVGTFLGGSSPNYGDIVHTVNKLWGRKGKIIVTGVGNNTFLFQIPDLATREWVLHSKIPWHVSQRTLYLQPWKSDLDLSKIKPSKMQIWVKIWGVPMTLYTPQGLGYVASAIGVPVCLDKATEERVHINYAQVCVEVDANKVADLPSSIPIDGVNQQPIELLFEYPWLPVRCGNCKKEGHLKRDCTKILQREPPKKQEWKVISRKKADEELEKVVSTVAATSHSSLPDLELNSQPPEPAKDIQMVSPSVLPGSVNLATSTH